MIEMLLTKIVKIKWNSNMQKYYINKGYKFTKMGEEFEINPHDLTDGSHVLVEVECDECKKNIKNVIWQNYKKYVKENEQYYCNKCASKLFGSEKRLKTRIKNNKSFEQWCLENNRQDILNRWDYELNQCKPSEICSKSKGENGRGYWFKCPRIIHKSELKNIISFTSGEYGTMDCKTCNSFAQWGIDNLGDDFLEKYWDYENNCEINNDPWELSYGNLTTRVWIKCQNPNKLYHGSYEVLCGSFTSMNSRCPYCSNNRGKVHPLDSLGKLLEDKGLLQLWSDKNKKSAYEYTPSSSIKKVWWKCLDGKHDDYYRSINSSNRYNFRCPECQFSQGEKQIEEYLDTNNIYNEMQKEFNGLLGVNKGNLSYDFYLPQHNLLIEYQGEFHDGGSGGYTKNNLNKQQEHDRRKREYAKEHNIRLLEIWYYDFDNIENILEKELNIQGGS